MYKKMLSVALVTMMAITVLLTGCSGSKNGEGASSTPPATNTDKETQTEQVTDKLEDYVMFAHGFQNFESDNDRVLQHLESKFNLKLHLNGAPWEGYLDKLGVKISTGETPDLFFSIPDQPNYKTWIDNGILLPISDYFDQAPNLKALFETEQFKNLKINDKYYFLPMISVANNHAIYYRKDWLDKVGLKEPTNIDEFYEMIKAFTLDDPDGNNKNDTIGLSGSKVLEWFDPLQTAFGLRPFWNKNDQGIYEPYQFTEGYKNYLAWMANAYKEGFIQKEFFLYDDPQKDETFFSGKSGVLISHSGWKTDEVMQKLTGVNPEAELGLLTPPDGPGGQGGMHGGGGWWGGWSISADAKDPERLVQLLDYLLSPEGQMLRLHGVEGIHYSMEADKVVANVEERKKEEGRFGGDAANPTGPYVIGQYFGEHYTMINNGKVELKVNYSIFLNPELAQRADELINKNIVFSDTTNILGFPEQFGEINQKLNDLSNKYSIMIISGEVDVNEAWDKMMKEVNEAGYNTAQQLVKETVDSLN